MTQDGETLAHELTRHLLEELDPNDYSFDEPDKEKLSDESSDENKVALATVDSKHSRNHKICSFQSHQMFVRKHQPLWCLLVFGMLHCFL